ncbi:MBL fold metallo-hydrolase [Sphingobacterium daejeonense]|uniref:AVAST type 1 anti-phage system MBL fold metallo-hydrolase Avs1a n=1 Tax=Sphingobacterium TaxID=28453 RepID=UPI00146B30B8|nr:AVAST type 1 anti-phage system MBL fold metallo-hydrolase Avs1a [Sphingobacterium daejeonense]MCT1533166.1 MBL fold metallo-hydrolase [Sphingobacterium daejeonense]
MNIHIKIYPAKNGDCFLISIGKSEKEEKNFLIDCGYVDTFQKYLKNDLIKIGENGGVLEKLILTHIDADHIQGAIRLLKDNNAEKFITIKEVWHNTYRHLSVQKEGEIDVKQERILQQIVRRGYPQIESKQGEQEISAEQGTTVGALLLQGNYSWNSDFDNQAVCIERKLKIALDPDAGIYLLSPDKHKLDKLKNLWTDELKKYNANFNSGNSQLYDDAFEMLLSWEQQKAKVSPKQISATKETLEELLKIPFDEDNTATNGSSIAFVLQAQDKKILFLADAHPGLIVQSLNEYQNEGTIIFDLIKVSHHGSFGNISRELLHKIDSEKYLISTNGQKHGHPDKETIAHIITRKAGFHRKLYFNYITANSKYFDRKDWKEKYNYSIHYLDQQPYTLTL